MKARQKASSRGIEKIAQDGPEDWPFSLREFVKHMKSRNPIEAAQKASTATLQAYLARYPQPNRPISVGGLCTLLGVKLKGKIPRTITSNTSLWVDQMASSRDKPLATFSVANNQPIIDLIDSHPARARMSVAHELGHFLIHRRDNEIDLRTMRSSSTEEEEALAEYIGRLLLIPEHFMASVSEDANCSSIRVLSLASRAIVSLYVATARLLDPDYYVANKMHGAIFWTLQNKAATLEERLMPHWHQCVGEFIPIHKCHVRRKSLIASVANAQENAHALGEEDVKIGSMMGRYMIDAFAWGSVSGGTRKVFSTFFAASEPLTV